MAYTLGIIGAGNIAEAAARGAIDAKVLAPRQVVASDVSEARRKVFASMKIAVTDDNAVVLRDSEQVLLAVKPQMLDQVAPLLAESFRDDQVLITVMAGVSTAKIEAAIGRAARIVRVMPNTPMMVGRGMAGVALGPHAQPGDDGLTMKLFTAGNSRAIRVEESQIDAITAVSGSGPAYLYYLAEAMHDAAVKLGIAEHADTLVRQTLLGAAALLDASVETPAALRRKVTSPGGTTEAAIGHMESQHVRRAVADAVLKAHARSLELGA